MYIVKKMHVIVPFPKIKQIGPNVIAEEYSNWKSYGCRFCVGCLSHLTISLSVLDGSECSN